ncbi:MAG: hypothetical protein V1891_01975 [bacterium]
MFNTKRNADNENDFNKGNLLVSWSFPEFIKYERSRKWYIIASVFTALLLIYSVFSYNFLLAVIVVMAVMIVLMREKAEPRKIKFSITERGVEIGDFFSPFRDIKRFSVVYQPPEVKFLYLEFKFKIKPRFMVQLGDQNPNEIRKILKEYIEEDLDRESESVSDALGRWLKI